MDSTTPALSGTIPAPASNAPRDGSPRRVLPLLGAVALIAGPLLIMGGVVTSPPQDSGSTADYIDSLARDPFVTGLSASLFHYGWIALALGMLAAIGLVQTRRGRALTVIGGLVAALTALQISGLLVLDFFNASLGAHLPPEQAAVISDSAATDPALAVWLQTGRAAIIAPALLWAGLARARVLSWWLVPLGLCPLIVAPIVGALLPGVVGTVAAWAVGVAGFAPAFVTARRLLRPTAPSA